MQVMDSAKSDIVQQESTAKCPFEQILCPMYLIFDTVPEESLMANMSVRNRLQHSV